MFEPNERIVGENNLNPNKVGGGERLKRQRSVDSESGSFRAEAAGSKAEADREKNELVKEEHRYRQPYLPREAVRSWCGVRDAARFARPEYCTEERENV